MFKYIAIYVPNWIKVFMMPAIVENVGTDRFKKVSGLLMEKTESIHKCIDSVVWCRTTLEWR